MRRIVIALVAVAALVVPSFSSSAVAPMELRCSDIDHRTVLAQRDGWSHDWTVTSGSVFHSDAGSFTAPDGRVVERWENPTGNPTANRGGFITCFGTVNGYRTEMEGSFTS